MRCQSLNLRCKDVMLPRMRLVILSTVLAGAFAFVIWVTHHEIVVSDHDFELGTMSLRSVPGEQITLPGCVDSSCIKPILDLELYTDTDYGFSVAIPAGWTRIVAAGDVAVEGNDVLASLEPGYAVGFESPREGFEDQFADYILIEVLPGDDIGLFESSDAQRRIIQSGSEPIAYDRLEVDGATDDASDVDLVIFQRGVKALGYTLGFYAIGEPTNEQAMFDAFQIILRTYNQTSDPFVII